MGKVEIKFIKKITNAGKGRYVIYIPKKYNEKLELDKYYIVTIKGPIEVEEIERILES